MTANKGFNAEVYTAAYERLGNYCAVAREFGVDESTVRRAIRNRRDPAIAGAMQAVGSEMVPSLAWIKTKPTDGSPGYSLLLKPQSDEPDLVEHIREVFSDLPSIEPIPEPVLCVSDLLTLYPVADLHLGMRAWGEETGEDYDTTIAARRLTDWMGRCVASSPDSDTAVILVAGDFLHADNQSNMTPTSGHILDVDTRFFRTLDIAIQGLAACIERALCKHKTVHVRLIPGNHDMTAYMAVLFALAERYRRDGRVHIARDPNEFFVMEWGRVLLSAHHGHKAKAERMVLFLADEYAEAWGRTQYRYLFTGHLHSHRSADIGGVVWEQLRALTARDAYAASNAFVARAEMQAITYDRERGEVQRVKVTA